MKGLILPLRLEMAKQPRRARAVQAPHLALTQGMEQILFLPQVMAKQQRLAVATQALILAQTLMAEQAARTMEERLLCLPLEMARQPRQVRVRPALRLVKILLAVEPPSQERLIQARHLELTLIKAQGVRGLNQ